MKNKVLSFILALAMIISCLSLTTVFADTAEYAVKSAYADSQNIYVVFSKNTVIDSSNDLTQISVKSIKGESFSTGTVTRQRNVITIPYTSDLTAGNSYYVILPEGFKSTSGAVVSNNAVRFTAPQSGTNYVSTVKRQFAASEISSTIVDFGAIDADFSIDDASSLSTGHSAALHVTTPTDSYSEAKYVRYLKVNDSNFGYSDEVVVSADFYFASFSRTGNISLMNGNGGSTYAYYFFDSYGNFVYLNGTGDEWSNEDKEDGNYSKNHSVKAGLKTQKWYTVKTVINKKNMTVDYYLGSYNDSNVYTEEHIATVPTVNSQQDFETNGKFSTYGNNVGELRVATYQKSSKKYIGDFYMDNINVGYNINTNITNKIAEQPNGSSWEKFDFSSSAGGGATYKDATVTTYNAATDKYGDEYVLSADFSPTIDSIAEKPIQITCLAKQSGFKSDRDSNLYFKLDSDGNLKMSKSLIQWWSDSYASTESVNVGKDEAGNINDFNIKFYVNKNNNKQVMVFVNDKFFRAVPLYWSSDVEDSTLVSQYPGIANFVTVQSNYAKNGAHKNGVVGHITEAIPEDITIKSGDNTYGIYTSNIPKSINTITLNYKGKAASKAFDAGKVALKNSDGTAVDAAASLSSDGKSIVITPSAKLNNGTYTISVSDIPCYDTFTTSFTVNDSSKVDYTSFNVTKSGNKYIPGIAVANTTGEEAIFVVIIGEYTNEEVPQLVSIDYKAVTVAAGASGSVDESDMPSITTSNTNTIIKAFVWDGISTMVPLADSAQYTAE